MTPAPSTLDKLLSTLRQMPLRRANPSWVGGVCAGVARQLGIDPTLCRAVAIVLGLLGPGIPAYLVAWLLVPADDESLMLERAVRGGENGATFLLVGSLVSLVALPGSAGWPHAGPADRGLSLGALAATVFVVVYVVRQTHGQAYVPPLPPPGVPPTDPATDPTLTSGPAGVPTYGAAAPYSPRVTYAPTQSATTTLPTAPVTYAAPRRPRRPALDPWWALLTTGVAVLSAVGTAAYVDARHPGLNASIIGLLVGLVVLSGALLLAGLAGRRGGLLVPLAVLGALTALTLSMIPSGIPFTVGERVVSAPDLAADSSPGLGIGELTLDLRDLPAHVGTEPQTIRADVGVGNVLVQVPTDRVVEVRATVGAGELLQGPGATLHQPSSELVTVEEGLGVDGVVHSGVGPPDLVVMVHVGLGEVRVSVPEGAFG